MESEQLEKKYNKWIVVLSILIPLVVATLFVVKIPNARPLHFLPPIYATINGITAILLVSAVWAIKQGKITLHQRLMKTAIGCSLVFLLMYIAYHMTTPSTKFGGSDNIRPIYFFILITHIILSIATIPLVLITFVRALAKRFDKHKKIAKVTFPIWLYVAVTGVVVYLMISPYYLH
ncbi:putative membrane protein [Pedobacter sp. UYEF25]